MDIETQRRYRANLEKTGTRIQFMLSANDIAACRTPDVGSKGWHTFLYIAQHSLWDYLYEVSNEPTPYVFGEQLRKIDYLKEVFEHPDYVLWKSTKGARDE